MADDDTARAAQEKRVKEIVKEALGEWMDEREKTRTDADAAKKKDSGFLGGLFS